MYLVGIDPSLTATGCVFLSVDEQVRGVGLVSRKTIRTKAKTPLHERLVLLRTGVEAFVSEFVGYDFRVIIEDPTDFKIQWGVPRNPTSIAKVGAAFAASVLGAECATLDPDLIVTVPSCEWIPRGTSHDVYRATLRRLYPDLTGCTDDETYAGGVALWWAQQQ